MESIAISRETMRERGYEVRLAFAFERIRWLSQMPSPAQSASEGWLALLCIRDFRIAHVTSCIAVCCSSALNDC